MVLSHTVFVCVCVVMTDDIRRGREESENVDFLPPSWDSTIWLFYSYSSSAAAE